MKVYKFFKIPNKDDNHPNDLEQRYSLYAITNKKEYAERFKEDRNMKKFIFKVYKGVTKEEYAEMCNSADRGAVLAFYPLTTVLNDNHTVANKDVCDVLMTYYEQQMITDYQTMLDDESLWRYMPFPLIFKSKYRKLLDALQYVTYYKLMSAEFLPYHLAEKLSILDDDYSAPTILYDEAALFVNMIKDTL